MDLKFLLLCAILAISVVSIRGQHDEDLDLPPPPPKDLVDFLDRFALERQDSEGGKWNWWEKIMSWWKNFGKGGKGGKGGKDSGGGKKGKK